MLKGAEAVVKTLESQGVEHIFGVCGDTSVGLYRAFDELDHDIDHVLARDERGASFMADAYARLSDKPGVCEGPSGGGATYLLPGLAEANDSSVPIVALNTTIPVRYRGRGVLTELDQEALYDPVTKWNASADHVDLVSRLLRRAFKESTTDSPGATHLSLPMDVLNAETDEPTYGDDDTVRYPSYRPTPAAQSVTEAAETLRESAAPVIVAGGGIHSSRAWEQLREFAEKIGVPVAQTLTSAGCIGQSPYSIGVVGENGSRGYANEIVTEADTLLLLGTAVESVWTEKWSQPADGEVTIIHADIDATSIGHNYRADVKLIGDLRETVAALEDASEPMEKWDADEIASRHEEWIAAFESEYDSEEFPLRPERMVADTRAVLDDDAVIVSDPGTSCPYFAALYDFRTAGRNWVTPRAHGALGYTIPGVVGAHYARPDSQVVGFTGDGSFGMTAGDLETIGRRELPVTIVVTNNAAFSWIEAGQRSYAEFSFGVEFDGLNYANIATEFGLDGYEVTEPDEYKAALEEAVNSDRPSLIDLPSRSLPSLPDTPVNWLEPSD